MKAILSRVPVALACLALWASANAGAATALPSTISQIRTAQFGGVNTIEALLYRWPHDYYAFETVQPLARTNVSVSGLTPEALTNKIREVAFQMACLATNFPLANNDEVNSQFLLVATAKEADIPTIFPEEGVDVPTTTLEMAQVNVTFPLVTNGIGGFRLPAGYVADTIPINVSEYVFLRFPDLKYFDGPPPPLFFRSSQERRTYAKLFTSNPDGSVSEIPSKAYGAAIFDQISSASYTTYLGFDGFKLLRFYNSGRIGVHLSLITNGVPAVLALEAADGSFPRYWLPTGQAIARPVLTSISLTNGAPKVRLVGIPNRRVVIESAISLGSTAVWNLQTTLTLPDQHGMTNYALPASLGPSTGPLRFLRLREE